MIKVANYDIYTNNKNKFYKMKLAVFKKKKNGIADFNRMRYLFFIRLKIEISSCVV